MASLVTGLFGRVVVLKRDGSDGGFFPLNSEECLFGRQDNCDVRLRVAEVSRVHCKLLLVKETGKAYLEDCSANGTKINQIFLEGRKELLDNDIISIGSRSFRFEYASAFENPASKAVAAKAPSQLPRPVNASVMETPKKKPPLSPSLTSKKPESASRKSLSSTSSSLLRELLSSKGKAAFESAMLASQSNAENQPSAGIVAPSAEIVAASSPRSVQAEVKSSYSPETFTCIELNPKDVSVVASSPKPIAEVIVDMEQARMETPPPAALPPIPAELPKSVPNESLHQRSPLRGLTRLHKSATKGTPPTFRNPLFSGSQSGKRGTDARISSPFKDATVGSEDRVLSGNILVNQLEQFVKTAKRDAASDEASYVSAGPSAADTTASATPKKATPSIKGNSTGMSLFNVTSMGIAKSASKVTKPTSFGSNSRRITINGAGVPSPRPGMSPQMKEVSRILKIDSARKSTLRRANSDIQSSPAVKSPLTVKVTFGPPLSPEIFDRENPPSTPVRRGRQVENVSSNTPQGLKSLLKNSSSSSGRESQTQSPIPRADPVLVVPAIFQLSEIDPEHSGLVAEELTENSVVAPVEIVIDQPMQVDQEMAVADTIMSEADVTVTQEVDIVFPSSTEEYMQEVEDEIFANVEDLSSAQEVSLENPSEDAPIADANYEAMHFEIEVPISIDNGNDEPVMELHRGPVKIDVAVEEVVAAETELFDQTKEVEDENEDDSSVFSEELEIVSNSKSPSPALTVEADFDDTISDVSDDLSVPVVNKSEFLISASTPDISEFISKCISDAVEFSMNKPDVEVPVVPIFETIVIEAGSQSLESAETSVKETIEACNIIKTDESDIEKDEDDIMSGEVMALIEVPLATTENAVNNEPTLESSQTMRDVMDEFDDDLTASTASTKSAHASHANSDAEDEAAEADDEEEKDVVSFKKQKFAMKPPTAVNLTGVRELFKSPKPTSGIAGRNLGGLRRLMMTPKLSSVAVPNLVGLREMVKTPRAFPVSRMSFGGVDNLFAEDEDMMTEDKHTENVPQPSSSRARGRKKAHASASKKKAASKAGDSMDEEEQVVVDVAPPVRATARRGRNRTALAEMDEPVVATVDTVAEAEIDANSNDLAHEEAVQELAPKSTRRGRRKATENPANSPEAVKSAPALKARKEKTVAVEDSTKIQDDEEMVLDKENDPAINLPVKRKMRADATKKQPLKVAGTESHDDTFISTSSVAAKKASVSAAVAESLTSPVPRRSTRRK